MPSRYFCLVLAMGYQMLRHLKDGRFTNIIESTACYDSNSSPIESEPEGGKILAPSAAAMSMSSKQWDGVHTPCGRAFDNQTNATSRRPILEMLQHSFSTNEVSRLPPVLAYEND